MKTREFIETLFEQTERELEEQWDIQRVRSGGEQFINSPMPTKKHILEGFDLSLETPCELEDEWTDEADELVDEYKNKISKIYDRLVETRIEFAKKHDIDVELI